MSSELHNNTILNFDSDYMIHHEYGGVNNKFLKIERRGVKMEKTIVDVAIEVQKKYGTDHLIEKVRDTVFSLKDKDDDVYPYYIEYIDKLLNIIKGRLNEGGIE